MNNGPLDAQVNLFADTYKPAPIGIIALAQALDDIRSGVYAEQIRYVRRMLARGEHSYKSAKSRLRAITFAGTFRPSRSILNLQQHTGIVHADLDHIPDLPTAKRAISGDPRTVYAFVSPRGDGLKFGVHVAVVADDPAYKHAWQTIATAYEQRYGGTWDPSGKDISRLCYVSHDPNLYVNLDAEVFDVPPAPPPAPHPPTLPRYDPISDPDDDDHNQDYGAQAIRVAVDMIQSAQPGTRHYARLRASRLLGGYVGGGLLSYAEALSALSSALQGFTEDMAGALKTVVDGLDYGEASPITKAMKDAERQSWLAAHAPTHHTALPQEPDSSHQTIVERISTPYRGYRGYRAYRGSQKGSVFHG